MLLLPKQSVLLLTALLTLGARLLAAQDSTATVYFFREGKLGGSLIGYDVKHQGNVIGRIKSNSVFVYQSAAGLQTFSGTTESESSMKIELIAGQTYFVECGLAVGVMTGRPVFRQVGAVEAQKKISKIDKAIAAAIPATLAATIQPNDTLRALQNMFQRKRKGGGTRAAVFGAITVVAVVGIASYKEPTVTINQGSAGTQTIPVGSGSPPTGNYLLAGFSAIMTITGFTQASKYSSEKLQPLLQDYKEGKPLPPQIKSKLKAKDFR